MNNAYVQCIRWLFSAKSSEILTIYALILLSSLLTIIGYYQRLVLTFTLTFMRTAHWYENRIPCDQRSTKTTLETPQHLKRKFKTKESQLRLATVTKNYQGTHHSRVSEVRCLLQPPPLPLIKWPSVLSVT